MRPVNLLGNDVPHGGNMGAARRRFPSAPEPFIDLSTGVNPSHYPFERPPVEAFTCLPEPDAVAELSILAARYYKAPSPAHVLPAPGTQALISLLPRLGPPGRAVILGETYAEHGQAAALAGHDVTVAFDVAALAEADYAVVVNPNNPDGRVFSREALLTAAPRGGLLVVDEAFMDVGPEGGSLAPDVGAANLLVLRSFGKFFGLPGVRLGFALGAPEVLAQIAARMGPWAVSGAALFLGIMALQDHGWSETARAHLLAAGERRDTMLRGHGFEVVGGTALFALIRHPHAAELYEHLGQSGILTRAFAAHPDRLRIGLPGDEAAWARLEAALHSFQLKSGQ